MMTSEIKEVVEQLWIFIVWSFFFRVGGELIILSRQSLVEFYLFGLMEIAIKLLGLS